MTCCNKFTLQEHMWLQTVILHRENVMEWKSGRMYKKGDKVFIPKNGRETWVPNQQFIATADVTDTASMPVPTVDGPWENLDLDKDEDFSVNDIPSIEDVWPYAKYLYTPDTINVDYGAETNGIACVKTIKSFNLYLTKDKVAKHLKCNCMYNTIQPFRKMKKAVTPPATTEANEHNIDQQFKWFYFECLKVFKGYVK